MVIITANLGKKILLLHKPPWSEKDVERQRIGKRMRVGIDKWGLPGGGNEDTDKSDIHAAQRETLQETGLGFQLDAFHKAGVLEGFRKKETIEQIWLVNIYTARAWPDMPYQVHINSEEHDKFQWFSIRYPLGRHDRIGPKMVAENTGRKTKRACCTSDIRWGY